MDLCEIDTTSSPPALRIPERFNAAHDLLDRNLRAGREAKIAYIDDAGTYTYGDLAARVNRFADSLHGFGLAQEQRILLCIQDGIDFPTAFLGAIKAGIVPIPVNTMLSAAKLFFAYGLGNSLTFPLALGGTAVLMAERATPASIVARLRLHRPTVFSGVPTLFASLLASDQLPNAQELSLRVCNSAGEALPEDIARRWRERTGVDIVDGIGSTEMLHIFISNRPDRIRYGTLGLPVPGFEVKIVDEDGNLVAAGETGHLLVRGSTSAKFYWNQHARSRATFEGYWTRTGDRFRVDDNGDYVYAGRADDMLKVGGIYVSPIEVESAVIAHPAVHEAAVVGKEDSDHLVKPMAYVVLANGFLASETLTNELKTFVKTRLAPYKYPRWIEYVADLPKTVTGKIQRFKLRDACKPTN